MQEYTQGGLNAGFCGWTFVRFSISHKRRWFHRAQRVEHEPRRLQPARRQSRQPYQQFEFENDTAAYNDFRYSPAQFNAFDRNRDGWLTRPESGMVAGEFDRLDTNRDNRISRFEFENAVTGDGNRSTAWRSGYDRGTQEGRAAGHEDFTRRQGWDLEGQRELEQADSGYTPQIGILSDYQAGYREGFRNAYRAGFTEAGGRAPR